jgi:DNA-binding transcriptional MerR regulator
MRELLQIGEVARLVGVSTKTIRYYHEIHLLPEPERTESGYRLYTAQHLLRLRRIRRLRALGLSLERIREILNEAPENNESTLRSALHSLVEETTAQILELEERRAFLQKLLSSEQLEPADENAYLFYSPELKEQLAPHLAHLSAESLEWGQRLDAMLGSFNWPAEYRQGFEGSLQHIADHAEQYRHLFALEERFAALTDRAADDPEVEQLAEAYAQSPDLPLLTQQMAQFGVWEEGPLTATLSGLTSSMLAPAQQRFFELLAQKVPSRHSDPPPTTEQEP